MQSYINDNGKFFILLVVACQLLSTSCSKKLYPEPSFQNISTNAEEKKLHDFMDAGIEKEIIAHQTHPDEIIKTAQSFIGVPHCMGGRTRKCMDCSGFLVTVFAAHGISLPHNSEAQARYGKIITGMDELRKGDMVFFIRTYKTHHFITHSGICIGNGQFIHTSSKNGVTITSLSDPWWNGKFIFGTRVFE